MEAKGAETSSLMGIMLGYKQHSSQITGNKNFTVALALLLPFSPRTLALS
jgi:hypothetical protein